ncbi:hypothetical protein [Polaribacter butkevichii]|uniref:PsbP C-terminal domain-containing protein n=1 Tax=Polaribacter butkevichii TaxID=218490 RepID=A0A2P6CDC2_9FLAO|nr:hypothetical protein [Polaribacter butkevichii]PQJ72897.1 hypothetical protein BTO14_06315 [Polaribacter butkevichii]
MKNILVIFTAIFLFYSCSQQSEISKRFNCKPINYKNLEVVKDVKNLFSIEIPKTWKTNLYYDTLQSSIYTADTTKQLTESLLLDVTYVQKNINFDTSFKLKQEQENLSKNLIQVKSEETSFLEKPSYYTISKGKKGAFDYQVCLLFIKLNKQNFILAKAEVYGDSVVNTRLCNAFALIEKIKIIQ